MSNISRRFKNKTANAQFSKKLMELAVFNGTYVTELGSLLVKKGIISIEEEGQLAKTAIDQVSEEIKGLLED